MLRVPLRGVRPIATHVPVRRLRRARLRAAHIPLVAAALTAWVGCTGDNGAGPTGRDAGVGDSNPAIDCSKGLATCPCGLDEDCAVGLICAQDGLCTSPAMPEEPPSAPRCYTPCRRSFVDEAGEYRACSVQGLMQGCLGNAACEQGSCIPEGKKRVSCADDLECPEHQACLEGYCYSNCDYDDDCGRGLKCHRHVCRAPCTADTDTCPAKTHCALTEGDLGYCMPLSPPKDGDARTVVEGTFELSETHFRFDNQTLSATLQVTNHSARPLDFELRKLEHTEYKAEGRDRTKQAPLPWLSIGTPDSTSPAQAYQFRVAGNGGAVELALSVSVQDVPERWEGVLQIQSPELGHQSIRLEYSTQPDGRWAGKVFYFSQFGDKNLDLWLQDRESDTQLKKVGNALLQKWGAMRQGRISFDEFDAVLTATTTSSWQWPSTRQLCEQPGHAACYLYTNHDGFQSYSNSLAAQPVPTGVVELPIALDLLTEDPEARNLKGRIASRSSLHYAGDPEVALRFASDPASCDADNKSACLTFIDRFSGKIAVGGRYRAEPSDTGCERVAGSEFELVSLPWIVPGFDAGTAIDDATGKRYAYECRERRYPFGLGDSDLESLNASFAASNPIPDGRPRGRTLELIDGALVNQNTIYLFFREQFHAGFLGDSASSFGAYGLMRLERTPAELSDDDFVGNPQPIDDDQAGVDLSATASCSRAMLDETLGRGKQLTNDTAGLVLRAMISGTVGATGESAYERSNVHYLCHETGLFDQGPSGSSSHVCPPTSNATYFASTDLAIPEDLRSQPCQENGTCQAVLDSWVDDPDVDVHLEPTFRCPRGTDHHGLECDDNRYDLRDGKVFLTLSDETQAFVPLRAAVADAFRYKSQFRDRQGRNIGFAPEPCVPSSNAVPYCYDPDGIERIRERVDCATHVYVRYYVAPKPDTIVLDEDTVRLAKAYLQLNFAYEEVGEQRPPQVVDGFERLYAELLIMLGDEAYTRAFQSRFDLAGSQIASFEGSEFEPGGIDLSGVAGYEMYTLYQATQYYQLALDRFYALSPYIWASLSAEQGSFISQRTVLTYFDRLLRASTQQSRAFAEIAKRYQGFSRPDLARFVVERAYTSTYIESIVLTRLIQRVVDAVDSKFQAQIVAAINQAAVTYRAALLDMREVHGALTDELTLFGFAPDYVPLPALKPGENNAFEVLLAAAHRAAGVAASREDIALHSNRSFETDSAAFQAELTRLRNTYENQLAELCGTMAGEDGRVYPAITKYAYLHPRARALREPCGLMGNGDLHEALAQVDLRRLDVESILARFDAIHRSVQIEQERASKQCGLEFKLADFRYTQAATVHTLEAEVRNTQNGLGALQRHLRIMGNMSQLASCIPPGATGAGDCATSAAAAAAFNISEAANQIATTGLEAQIASKQTQIDTIERLGIRVEAQHNCDVLNANSLAVIQDKFLGLAQLNLEALQTNYQVRLALSSVVRIRNQALRVAAEQEEVEQLAINIEAARNDPNVRIYKNDAVVNADRTFQHAIKEAYRATRVYEYYTSQSYKAREQLGLVRLVSRGDYNLDNYLRELASDYDTFLEDYGLPDTRVDVLSLRDDLLAIPRYDESGALLTQASRVQLFRDAIADPKLLNARGYLSIPFTTALARTSPLTRNHKILHVEAELIGSDVGDPVGRLYLTQAGTGMLQPLTGQKNYYRLPERTAVLNPFFNGVRAFGPEVYRNDRLRDRPYVNSSWELLLNQRDELVNQDINLAALSDIRLHLYYTDFTAL